MIIRIDYTEIIISKIKQLGFNEVDSEDESEEPIYFNDRYINMKLLCDRYTYI